jgi:oligopeptide/dipeptide ABC transporter ATP-binding protein
MADQLQHAQGAIALSAHNVSVQGPSGVLVADVSLRAERGRCVGVIGQSGSGKTLTLKALMGLTPSGLSCTISELRVAANAACVDRQPAGAVPARNASTVVDDPATLRGATVAMVFQDPLASLDPTTRCGNLIAEVVRHHDRGTRSTARTRVLALLREVGFGAPARVARSFPHQLSNGQRQRVVLALALACRPKVLLCDEATSALDVTTQAQIIDLLRELQLRHELAIVFVAHDLALTRQIADELIVMHRGAIVEVGPIADVLGSPRHPYTRSLVASAVGHPISQGDAAESDDHDDTGRNGVGCSYRHRCSSAVAACSEPMRIVDATRLRRASACVLDDAPMSERSAS